MCFDENGAETIAILAEIRRHLFAPSTGARKARTGRRSESGLPYSGAYRAFEQIDKITPAVALVLAAEYDRWRIVKGIRPSLYNLSAWKPAVHRLLQEIGFLELFEHGDRAETPVQDNGQIVLRMRSGKTHRSSDIHEMVTDLRQLFPGDPAMMGDDADETRARMMALYEALAEAVGNVIHHAYREGGNFAKPSVGAWWMTGSVDRSRGWTSAAVYDQGVTIPASLPNWTKYTGVLKRLAIELGQIAGLVHYAEPRWDGHAIAAAVEESVSSTGQPGRGLGLAQMRSFVDACTSGHLRILSRHGEVVFRPKRKPIITRHSAAVGGTLIEWSVLI